MRFPAALALYTPSHSAARAQARWRRRLSAASPPPATHALCGCPETTISRAGLFVTEKGTALDSPFPAAARVDELGHAVAVGAILEPGIQPLQTISLSVGRIWFRGSPREGGFQIFPEIIQIVLGGDFPLPDIGHHFPKRNVRIPGGPGQRDTPLPILFGVVLSFPIADCPVQKPAHGSRSVCLLQSFDHLQVLYQIDR
jgi:hypothetical protein